MAQRERPLRMAMNNRIGFFTLTSDVAPLTDLEYVKDELAARRTRFAGGQTYTITGSGFGINNLAYFAVLFDGSASLNYTLEVTNGGAVVASYGPFNKAALGYSTATVGNPAVVLFPIPFDGVGAASNGFNLIVQETTGSPSEIRHIALGDMYQFDRHLSYNSGLVGMSAPRLVDTLGGSNLPTPGRRPVRRLALDLEQMSIADREQLWTYDQENPNSAFIIDGYPARTGIMREHYQFLARFSATSEFSHWADKNNDPLNGAQSATAVEIVQA